MPEEPEIEALLAEMTEEERESFREHEQRVRAAEFEAQRTYGSLIGQVHETPSELKPCTSDPTPVITQTEEKG